MLSVAQQALPADETACDDPSGAGAAPTVFAAEANVSPSGRPDSPPWQRSIRIGRYPPEAISCIHLLEDKVWFCPCQGLGQRHSLLDENVSYIVMTEAS